MSGIADLFATLTLDTRRSAIAGIVDEELSTLFKDVLLTLVPKPGHRLEFTQSLLSTITVEAKISNCTMNEKDLPVLCEPTSTVVVIMSNFCKKVLPGYVERVKHPGSRGRHKVARVQTRRQTPGTGTCMNSQTSFMVLSPSDPNKLYKVKVFRTGKVQIPGSICDDLSDAAYAISETRKVIAGGLNVPIESLCLEPAIKVVMKNTKWAISDTRFIIDLDQMFQTMLEIKDQQHLPVEFLQQNIKYNAERYQGMIFKIRSRGSLYKHATFKVFRSGKINMTTGGECNDANMLKEWFLEFIRENEAKFIYDVNAPVADDESESDVE